MLSQRQRRAAAFVPITIAVGLSTRAFPDWWPSVVVRYGGDVLWASMVYWLVALVAPRQTVLWTAGVAVATAWVVELSQWFHPAWLDAIRATLPGRLVLGQGFLASDLVCYAVGVACAMGVDAALCARER